MKKTGIITFHASYNCGSMLQAYALQTTLEKKYGVKNEIIDFSNEEQQRMYSILYKPRTVKDALRNVLNIFFYSRIKKHNDDYQKFSAKFLRKSKNQYSSLNELTACSDEYNCVVTGSDQVWNIRAGDFDDAYFLPFVKSGKKVAYAVSLGATNPNSLEGKEKYARMVNDLDAVSVREYNAKKWLEELSEKKVDICVDPTLLLSEQEWLPVTGDREVSGKYIFWYTMIYKKEICDIVVEIGKKYGLPIYVLDAKEWSRRALYLRGIKLARNGGPSSYLSLVKNAEMVITSSFHGTVFCNVFKKNFWYINIHDVDTNDDRALYLLTQLGLQDRYVKKNEILSKDLMEKPDYTKKKSIDENIAFSKNFIAKNIVGE